VRYLLYADFGAQDLVCSCNAYRNPRGGPGLRVAIYDTPGNLASGELGNEHKRSLQCAVNSPDIDTSFEAIGGLGAETEPL